jgi:uncharacterized protein YggU (UPF0235/DUF167 family)
MARATPGGEFWRATEGGVRVAVKVRPKSRRPGLDGTAPAMEGARLRIAVSEAAEEGRANRAACAALARALGVAASAVTVAAGAASRDKVLEVAGDPALLSDRLSNL